MNNYCTFYIVRHGQTDWNAARLLQGQKDTHLTKAGEEQLQKTKEELAHVAFDAVFASDLERAIKSAEIIRGEKNLPILTSSLLRERSYGKHEGKTLEEFNRLEATLATLDEKTRFAQKMDTDIESDKELMDRLEVFLKKMVKEYTGKTVLIVSHGAVIQAFLVMIGFGTYKTLPERLIVNGSFAKVRADENTYYVEEIWGISKINE